MRPQDGDRTLLPYNPGPDGPAFTLHDGPPYANGRLHMGHALNKLLKDMVLRDKRRQGFHAPFLTNWDCHGLPLEQRFAGERERFSSTTSYLAMVEKEARKWADLQSDEFQCMGVAFNPDQSSLSCNSTRQALVMGEFHRMAMKGLVSHRSVPSSWSPVDQTVLAGAETVEVEKEVTVGTVLFPLEDGLDGEEAYLAVWTTTPWSLPGNAGVAYNPSLTYWLHRYEGRLLVALQNSFVDESVQVVRQVTPSEMAGMRPKHPFHDAGYPLRLSMPKLMPALYVTPDKGTGLVHVGPAHSAEDHSLWLSLHGSMPFPDVVGEDGYYHKGTPLFEGRTVVKGDDTGDASSAVLAHLHSRDMLLEPHAMTLTMEASWRSGGLLVKRPTSQWFVDLEVARARAVNAVESDQVRMVPERSRARFLSMLRTRPDWLVSRQREWGVPLGLYVHRKTGEPLFDPKLLQSVQNAVREHGLAGWWEVDAKEHFTLAGRTDHNAYEKVRDVLDVWFDSACVQNYGQPLADLVVEGSDQHRGWYSSSLLKAMALDDPLPFKTVLTHGFVVTADRRKMSKSDGNGMTPAAALKKWSRDVLRLWVAHVDVTEDVPMSASVLDEAAQTHKAMRNTLRYLTGVLRDWSEDDASAPPKRMENLLLVAELQELERNCDKALEDYDMRRRMEVVRDFMSQRLSGFHLDARKDLLYCRKGSPQWHEGRHTLMLVYAELLKLLDPLCPDLVTEMASACKPQDLPSAPPYAHLLRWVPAFTKLANEVTALAQAEDMKLGKSHLNLPPQDSDTLVAFGSEATARFLKVDAVVLGESLQLQYAHLQPCARCRLHRVEEEGAWCEPCSAYRE